MSTKAPGFLALNSRYVIEGTLMMDAGMHIGSGMPGPDTDSAFIRDVRGPLIPGSSLRGVLRSTIERILQTLDRTRGCVVFVEDPGSHCLSAKPEAARKLAVKGKSEEELMELFEAGGQCDVCRLFGSVLLASKLRLSDCRPQTEPKLQKRDGVGIDRDTETAKERIKFDFEVLEAGTVFDFHLQLENATESDFALLWILLTEMTVAGVDIGGKKARGLGRCKLRCDYRITYFDNSGEYKLSDFLINRRLATMTTEVFNAMCTAHLTSYLGGLSHVPAVA